mgnify:CR=1 FL=1
MLSRHLAGYLPLQIAQAIAGFGAIAALTRILSPEEFGRYALCLAILGVAHSGLLLWVEAAALRFFSTAREKGEEPDHFKTLLWLHLGALAVFAAGTVLAILLIPDPGWKAALGAALAGAFARSGLKIALETRRAEGQVGRVTIVESAHVLIGFGLGVMLAAYTGLGAAGPFVGMAAAAVLCLALEGPAILARARGGRADPDRARAYAAYGLPIAGAIVLDLALSTSDRFLIAAFLGEAATGAYAAGYQLGNRPIEILMLWAVTASSPLLMAAWERGGAEAVRALARQTFTAMVAVGAPAAVGVALVAEPFAELLVGPELRADAAMIAPWTAVSALMGGLMIHYFSESFQLVRRTDLRALMVAVPALINIGLNLVLIPMFGLMGAVGSTVAAYAIGVVVMALAGRRFIPLPVDFGVLARTAIGCAAMAGAVLLLPSPGGIVELVAKAATGAGVYALAAVLLDLGGVRSMLRARFHPATAA